MHNHSPPLSIVSLLAIILGWLLSGPTPKAVAAPNVVLILADDHSYQDFGFLGNTVVHTPRLDRLAAESARYPNGYVPMSVCRPSLATVLTGLYPHQHGLYFNHPPPGLNAMRNLTAADYHAARASTDYLIRNASTLPRILAAHGYACLQTGKHWEGSYRNAGFTHGMTRGLPAKELGPTRGTRTQQNGEWVAHGNGDAGLAIGRDTMQPIDDFVGRCVRAGQPFFVWYAPFLPHTPYDAPASFREPYHGRQIPTHLLPYYAEISRFDETVGRLLDTLDRLKVRNETLVVFAADNGLRPSKSRPDRQNARSKLSPFEDGLRTPILLRMPGTIPSGDYVQLVQTIDLAPTILSAVGLQSEITSRMRGCDLFASARRGAPPPDRPAFGAIYPNDAKQLGRPSMHVRGKWIRDGQYKLIIPGPAPKPLVKSLYDLKHDPRETNNLIEQPGLAHRIQQLESQLRKWWPEGDDSRVTRRQ